MKTETSLRQVHKFTVHDYYKMAEIGILTEDSRVELIEGEIIDMVPIGSKHASMVTKLTRILTKMVGDSAIISPQNPLHLPNDSEPEPDIMILRPRVDDYGDSHPEPDDVLLLIEVSDTSLPFDRLVKLPLYARYKVPVVWIIDLNSQHLELYRQPQNGEYGEYDCLYGNSLAPLPTLLMCIKVGDLFSPRTV